MHGCVTWLFSLDCSDGMAIDNNYHKIRSISHDFYFHPNCHLFSNIKSVQDIQKYGFYKRVDISFVWKATKVPLSLQNLGPNNVYLYRGPADCFPNWIEPKKKISSAKLRRVVLLLERKGLTWRASSPRSAPFQAIHGKRCFLPWLEHCYSWWRWLWRLRRQTANQQRGRGEQVVGVVGAFSKQAAAFWGEQEGLNHCFRRILFFQTRSNHNVIICVSWCVFLARVNLFCCPCAFERHFE